MTFWDPMQQKWVSSPSDQRFQLTVCYLGIFKGIIMVDQYPKASYTIEALSYHGLNWLKVDLAETYEHLMQWLEDIPVYYMKSPKLTSVISSTTDTDRLDIEDMFDRTVWEILLRGSVPLLYGPE